MLWRLVVYHSFLLYQLEYLENIYKEKLYAAYQFYKAVLFPKGKAG